VGSSFPGTATTLRVANFDGSSSKEIPTEGLTEIGEPTFSADGEEVLFKARESAGKEHLSQIYSIKTDGADQRKRTSAENVGFSSPSATPDGAKVFMIGFGAEVGDDLTSFGIHPLVACFCQSRIWEMNSDGSDLHPIRSGSEVSFWHGGSGDHSCTPEENLCGTWNESNNKKAYEYARKYGKYPNPEFFFYKMIVWTM
jgi:hypothetical protein